MGHAGHLGDLAGVVEPVEPGIAIGMHEPAIAGQMIGRMFALAETVHTGLNWEAAHQQTGLSRDAADEYVRQAAERAGLDAGLRATSLHVYVERRFEGTYRIQREAFDVVAGTSVEYQLDGKSYRGLLLNGKTTYASGCPGQLSDGATAIITITVLAIIGVLIAAALGAFN
jgi:hypothetical protein